jgi:hypothetical protein
MPSMKAWLNELNGFCRRELTTSAINSVPLTDPFFTEATRPVASPVSVDDQYLDRFNGPRERPETLDDSRTQGCTNMTRQPLGIGVAGILSLMLLAAAIIMAARESYNVDEQAGSLASFSDVPADMSKRATRDPRVVFQHSTNEKAR